MNNLHQFLTDVAESTHSKSIDKIWLLIKYYLLVVM